MQDQAVRDLVWKELFEAEVRYRYFGALAGKLKSWQKRLALIVAAGSASAFIALATKLPIPDAPLVLSGIVAVAGAILASQKYDKESALSAELGRKWGAIRTDYNVLWLELDDIAKASALERYRQIDVKKVSAADELAVGEFGKVSSRLYAKCDSQARAAGGFEKAA